LIEHISLQGACALPAVELTYCILPNVLTLPAASLQDFNVLRYKPGQHYHSHMDTFDA
jgi:hypothetical protein